MRLKELALAAALLILPGACGERSAEKPGDSNRPAEVDAAALLDAAINDASRPEDERARDQWRHPRETLQFFGVEPSMVVVEAWPGGGWYTRILAPYLDAGGGAYRAALPDPATGNAAAAAAERFRADFADTSKYGAIAVTTIEDAAQLGQAEVVLTFRNVHNWAAAGVADEVFQAFFSILKPGGVLGVVEHRANEDGRNDPLSGYMTESSVRKLAENAGFRFAASSEINANPLDTKDHPFGVWTLPPTRRSSAVPGQVDPAFDRSKYDAIGESDRMTLKFIKPAS